MAEKTLIIGGAKSGKSSLAQKMAEAQGGRLIYLATAQARDQEMTERIRRHQKQRGPAWGTLEEPLELTRALEECDQAGVVVLVDCLTLWLSNLMTAAEMDETALEAAFERLAASLPKLKARVILVANEVGMGIVPQNELARKYRDLAGVLNQRLARVCDQVIFVAAGLPLVLKGPAPEL